MGEIEKALIAAAKIYGFNGRAYEYVGEVESGAHHVCVWFTDKSPHDHEIVLVLV